jgi:phosphatidylserine/phosphatidylglycerophosphate/cardiolipin synthase-like enzyme
VAGPVELKTGYLNGAVYTSPHATPDLDPKPALVAMLKAAKKSIRFAIYSFTLPEVADAIIAAHQAGLDVRGVVNFDAWTSATSQVQRLVAAGVDVHRWGQSYRLMHDKVAVVDGTAVALGSYHWTTQAEKSNVEVLLIVIGRQVSRVLAPVFTKQIEDAYAAGTT